MGSVLRYCPRGKLRLITLPEVMLESLRQQLRPGSCDVQHLRWINASIGNTTCLLPVDEVLYFQAQDKYTRVVTANAEALIRTSVKDLIEGLEEGYFWQVHRSVIVRADAVDHVRRDELGKYQLRLRRRDECLPLSSAFQHRFNAMCSNFRMAVRAVVRLNAKLT